MTEYGSGGSTLGRVVKWLVIGIVAIIALRVGLFLLGAAVKASFFILFTLGPLVLVGWLVMKFLRWISRNPDAASY
ncbi:MAG TPA: hypothetical protein VMN39_05640 [Longimicrobiaceae bacterium]|nr:hypothetical protein [Longimicrobiaceae bacterium]